MQTIFTATTLSLYIHYTRAHEIDHWGDVTPQTSQRDQIGPLREPKE